jgi:hypothetical protein
VPQKDICLVPAQRLPLHVSPLHLQLDTQQTARCSTCDRDDSDENPPPTRRTGILPNSLDLPSCRMSRDAQLVVTTMDPAPSSVPGTPLPRRSPVVSSRMQYRSRPVTVAVDPVSLIISECIAITSAIQKTARSQYASSVSAILGGSPNLIQLVPPPGSTGRRSSKALAADTTENGAGDLAAKRWGLRGKKGKSMQDKPLISGFGRLRHELTGVKGERYQMQRRDSGLLTCGRHSQV